MNSLLKFLLIGLTLLLVRNSLSHSHEDIFTCIDETTGKGYNISDQFQIINECKVKVCTEDGTFTTYGCPEFIYTLNRSKRLAVVDSFPNCCPSMLRVD